MVFYRTLEEILKKRFEKNKEKMFKDAVNLFKKIYRDYIRRLEINITRTEFLLKKAITILENKKFWWYKNEIFFLKFVSGRRNEFLEGSCEEK